MKTTLKTIKADLYRVFIAGDAKSQEIARVFIVLAIPLMSAMAILGHLPRY